MHILTPEGWTAPNGAACAFHRIQMIITIEGQGSVATVNSHVSADQPLIGWQDRVIIPDEALTGPPMPCAAAFLIAEGGYLAGGTIVEDEPAPSA